MGWCFGCSDCITWKVIRKSDIKSKDFACGGDSDMMTEMEETQSMSINDQTVTFYYDRSITCLCNIDGVSDFLAGHPTIIYVPIGMLPFVVFWLLRLHYL